MKILFIGGTGNISNSTSKLCVAKGLDLWLLNRSGLQDITGATSLQMDINSAQAASELANHQWDVVVNWVAFTEADIERDIALFSGKTKQYIYISSASCYLNPGPTPFITENTPRENPFWQYSRDKIAAEQRLVRAGSEQKLPYTIVRPSHTYSTVFPLTIGGWNEYTAVDRMKKGLPVIVQGDGTSLWTVTHADDFAIGMVGLLGHPKALFEDFHITSDEFLSWNEIYQQLAQAAGCEAKIVHVTSDRICQKDPEYIGTLLGDKAVSTIFDNSKIKQLVPEFKATIPFAEGIKRTLAYFDADPARQFIDPATVKLIEDLVAETQQLHA